MVAAAVVVVADAVDVEASSMALNLRLLGEFFGR
ncbi:MAG: hypothetical protein RLY70_2697, partial [Planctomycetota bacterium]